MVFGRLEELWGEERRRAETPSRRRAETPSRRLAGRPTNKPTRYPTRYPTQYPTAYPFSSPEWAFIGCFEDSHDTRDLPHHGGKTDIDGCAERCAGYKYWALQAVRQCWCGDRYGTHGRRPDYECGPRRTTKPIYYKA